MLRDASRNVAKVTLKNVLKGGGGVKNRPKECYVIVEQSLTEFVEIEAISRQKEVRSQDYALLLFRMTSRVLYSAQHGNIDNTVHSIPLNTFGAMYAQPQ